MRNFKVEDLEGAGHYLVKVTDQCRERINNGKKPFIVDTGYLSTVMYKVGYNHNNDNPDKGQRACLISMSDGWVRDRHLTRDESKAVGGRYEHHVWETSKDRTVEGMQLLIDHLNSDDSEEMRFATQEEVVRVVMYQSHRWRN